MNGWLNGVGKAESKTCRSCRKNHAGRSHSRACGVGGMYARSGQGNSSKGTGGR